MRFYPSCLLFYQGEGLLLELLNVCGHGGFFELYYYRD